MSIPPALDQNEWDVRLYSLSAIQPAQNAIGMRLEGSRLIESLLETIDAADAAATDGWHVARVKIEADEDGRSGLNVWLKRQKSTTGQVPVNVPPTHRAA